MTKNFVNILFLEKVKIMFEEGKIYRRSELHDKFGGQRQGGISTPRLFPFIMLFSSESGEEFGYVDGFKSKDIYWYTGEGQIGDMQFIRGNRAIKDSNKNGKSIHVFEYVSTGIVRYIGEMSYIKHHESQTPDINGDLRRAIIFELACE
jgi:5-methylcytosine-specific restriction protein A